MAANHHRGVKKKRHLQAVKPDPAQARAQALVELVNSQVLPQLQHLVPGPLAVGAHDALRVALAQGTNAVATVLHQRLAFEGKVVAFAVQVLVNPE